MKIRNLNHVTLMRADLQHKEKFRMPVLKGLSGENKGGGQIIYHMKALILILIKGHFLIKNRYNLPLVRRLNIHPSISYLALNS